MRTSVQTKEIRDAILDATDQLLARYGYGKMTIDDLAKEVGIGKGSIYLHFASKEEIALSHVDRIIERLCTRLESISDEKIMPEKKLEKMLLMRVTFRFDSVQHYTQSINDLLSSLRSKLLEHRKLYHENEAALLAKVIKEGQTKKKFQPGDPLETARLFLLATNSLLPFNLTTSELGERSDIEKKTQKIAKILLKGIKK
ncbi:MAG: TetR/AcrR family transcriptional regulator [Pyrinomonadaceae bacterium]